MWLVERTKGPIRIAEQQSGAMYRRMVRRRVSDGGIETSIDCHSCRATGITDYLTNGGRIEVAQNMAGHSNPRPLDFTTGVTMM